MLLSPHRWSSLQHLCETLLSPATRKATDSPCRYCYPLLGSILFYFLFLMIGKYFSLVNLNRFKTQGLPINLSSPTLSPSPRLCRSLGAYLCFASCPQCQREVGPGGGTPVQPSAGTTQLCSDTEELPGACSPRWEHDGPCTTTWVQLTICSTIYRIAFYVPIRNLNLTGMLFISDIQQGWRFQKSFQNSPVLVRDCSQASL